MGTDDAEVAELFSDSGDFTEVGAGGLRAVTVPQLEIRNCFEQRLGVPRGERIARNHLVQRAARRGDELLVGVVAVGVGAEVDGFDLPFFERFRLIAVGRADVDRVVEAEAAVGFVPVGAAEIGFQVVIHPAVHLAGETVGPFVVESGQHSFTRGHCHDNIS